MTRTWKESYTGRKLDTRTTETSSSRSLTPRYVHLHSPSLSLAMLASSTAVPSSSSAV
ncbi:uncharacterized protein RHOBADRAFT_65449 [Rhodotorula graminis WP1]|uniref:Uncharacterized protein n=1 Tax=Rhodotorula graminis (strain WP1) TaxID=578459 RepID=A0A0P9F1G9_RHOGW|nr:uncharacterized protein RHOBADRAFT_65449 [Rhodotorula graminis WP1]KPV73450.1 hypothetical protein RHOBADRAFT_65449 [Rhodotorula graminis WP1]